MPRDVDQNRRGALGEVPGRAVARVRFGVVPNPATPLQDDHGRLVIELQTASVPVDGSGTFDAAVRTLGETHPAHDEPGSLDEATAEYFTQLFDDQSRTVWATPDVLGWADVSARLNSCQQSLLVAVRGQIEALATGAGGPALPATLGAGIGADLILAPEMRLEERLSFIIDIWVMGIAFAAGQPHLAAVAVKDLMHTAFNNAIKHGADEIIKGLLNPAPAGPAPTGSSWIKPEQREPGGKVPDPPLDVVDPGPQPEPVQEEPEHTEYKFRAAPDPAHAGPAARCAARPGPGR